MQEEIMIDGQIVPRYLTIRQVSKMLGTSYGHVYAMVRSGSLPAVRFGTAWRLPIRRLLEHLESLEEEAIA